MISIQQQKRIDKLKTDEFYLIGFTDRFYINENSELIMSGSTKNIYKINLSNNGSLDCNCPDSSSHAKKYGVLCKHICFIYLKICKSIDESFFDNQKLSTLDIKKLKLRIGNITNTNTAKIYYNNYLKQLNNELNFDKPSRKIHLDDLDCLICFDELSEDIKFCPDCSIPIHKKCINKWLESNDTCVYCRSGIWKKYNDDDENKKNYINLDNKK